MIMRIHIEQVIGSVRQCFTIIILSASGVLPKHCYRQMSEDGVLLLGVIVRVCCSLNNMCVGIYSTVA